MKTCHLTAFGKNLPAGWRRMAWRKTEVGDRGLTRFSCCDQVGCWARHGLRWCGRRGPAFREGRGLPATRANIDGPF